MSILRLSICIGATVLLLAVPAAAQHAVDNVNGRPQPVDGRNETTERLDVDDPIVAATTAVRALESLRERSGQLRECLGGATHPGFEPATRTLNAATLTAGRAPDERDVKAWMDANDGSWYVYF